MSPIKYSQFGFARSGKSLLARPVLQGAELVSDARALALVCLLPNHVLLDRAHFLLTTKALNFALHFLQGEDSYLGAGRHRKAQDCPTLL